MQWSGVSAAASAQASHSRNKVVIERRLRGSLGIGVARNEVEMGRSSASAGDGSETLSDKDFPGSVFSHGVFAIRNGAFFSSALPQLET